MNLAHLPMAGGGLTPTQLDCARVIQEWIALRNISPLYEEIRRELNMGSKSGVSRLINGLADRGILVFKPHSMRSIELVRRVPVPDSLAFEYSDAERAALGIARPAEVAS